MSKINEAIKNLPAKTDWNGLLNALVALHNTTAHKFENSYCHKSGTMVAITELRGVRDMRFACESAGNWYGRNAATTSTFIAPSPETLSWGGFLGGEHVVTINSDIEEACNYEVLAVIAKFS